MMTKEQQKLAAEKIMAKHPLTPEDEERLRFLTMKIEDYPEPDPKRIKEAAEYWKKLEK